MSEDVVQGEPQQNRQPVVFEKDGAVFASSRDVAEFFDKEHRNVMQAIDNLIVQEPRLTPAEFSAGVYTLTATGEQQHRCFEMTRDGFTLLAMGFTGAKALQWKLLYIEAFNAMEAQLRQQPEFKIPQTYAEALRVAADLSEQVEQQKLELDTAHQEIAGLLPAAGALERIAGTDGTFSTTEAAKLLQMQPKKLTAWMIASGWVYRRAGTRDYLAYQARIQSGWVTMKVDTIRTAKGDIVVNRVRITTKGLTKLAKELGVVIDQSQLASPAELFKK